MDDKRRLLSDLAIDRAAAETGSPRPWLIATVAAGALLLGIGGTLLLLGRIGGEESRPAAPPPERAEPTPSPSVPPAGERVLNASGYVTARRMATVSAEITGRITEVLVEEGMRVEEGQVLARLDDAVARVDFGLAEAQVSVAEAAARAVRADLAEAERVLRRVSALNLRDFSSEAERTRAEAEVEKLVADLSRAEADMEVARLQASRARERLDDHVIRAPFAGVVTDKNAQPGEIVAPGSAGGGFTRTGICTLVDMASLEIEVDVNESFIGRVAEGQPVEARLDAYPDWAIPARVLAIIPTANRDKATVKVRIGFEETDPRVLPEMGVNVAFLKG